MGLHLLWKRIVRGVRVRRSKGSLRHHGSVWVTDIQRSLEFYRKLGFRRIASSRNSVVTLLRNRSGDELNLVYSARATSTRLHTPTFVSFDVISLEGALEGSADLLGGLEISESPIGRIASLLDPDSNTLEFIETRGHDKTKSRHIFHIVVPTEFGLGLGESYYSPPEGRYQFVRCGHNSVFGLYACQAQYATKRELPLVIKLDERAVNLQDEVLLTELDLDAEEATSTFPVVYGPIPKLAMLSVGHTSISESGNILWPAQFKPLNVVSRVGQP